LTLLPAHDDFALTPSLRTRRAEMLRLCARIGYSPPAFPKPATAYGLLQERILT